MDPEPKMIRRDIERTRSALTEKLETLEHEVLGTVQGTRHAVTATVDAVRDTVENVKGTVEDALESVKETLDVKRQTRRHPWPMFGASLATGFVLGTYLPATAALRRARTAGTEPLAEPYYQAMATHEPAPPPRPSLLGRLAEQFAPEIRQLKALAIGTGLGIVRDSLRGSLPPALEPHVEEVIHNITRKIGGEEIEGPILDT